MHTQALASSPSAKNTSNSHFQQKRVPLAISHFHTTTNYAKTLNPNQKLQNKSLKSRPKKPLRNPPPVPSHVSPVPRLGSAPCHDGCAALSGHRGARAGTCGIFSVEGTPRLRDLGLLACSFFWMIFGSKRGPRRCFCSKERCFGGTKRGTLSWRVCSALTEKEKSFFGALGFRFLLVFITNRL